MSGDDEEDLLDNLISRVQKEKKNDEDIDDQEDNFLGSLENFMENDVTKLDQPLAQSLQRL